MNLLIDFGLNFKMKINFFSKRREIFQDSTYNVIICNLENLRHRGLTTLFQLYLSAFLSTSRSGMQNKLEKIRQSGLKFRANVTRIRYHFTSTSEKRFIQLILRSEKSDTKQSTINFEPIKILFFSGLNE